jgi:type IV secretory pathway protease TraF
MFGLALTCHVASIIDIVNGAGNELGWRISIFASCLGAVALAVYLPVGWLVTRLAVPITIAVDNPPFYAGDVMLYAPTRFGLVSPAPGKLVLYELPNVVLQAEGHVQYHVTGQRIDRILAGPGQRVVWHDSKLEVDGQPSSLVPVNPSGFPTSFDLTAPVGHFVIFPSTLGVSIRGSKNSADFNRISLIPAADVLGEVYWRQQPWSRQGRIH